MLGYAYILTHPGCPTVFWEHMFSWEGLHKPIAELVSAQGWVLCCAALCMLGVCFEHCRNVEERKLSLHQQQV
jgi:hypothetical protein